MDYFYGQPIHVTPHNLMELSALAQSLEVRSLMDQILPILTFHKHLDSILEKLDQSHSTEDSVAFLASFF